MHGIYCIMTSGLPVTEQLREALLINAYDMWENKRPIQRVKSRSYDGVIETNFEPICFVGSAGFLFDALMGTPLGETQIKFFVRTSELENFSLESGRWVKGMIVEVEGEDEEGEEWKNA